MYSNTMINEDNNSKFTTSRDSTSYDYDAEESMMTISAAQNSTTHAELVASTSVLGTDTIQESITSSPYSPDIVIVLSVVVGVIIFMTIVGNLLTVASFCTTPKLRTYNNYFILGLAIADLLAGALVMPLYAVIIITGRWPFGENFCDIFTCLDHFCSHVSILLVTLISLDRCIAVTYPFRHRQHWRRRSRAILIIAVSYVIPVIVWLPMTILWKVIHGIDQRLIPEAACEPLYITSVIASVISPFFYFFIPFTITAILCARIYVVIKKFYKGRKKMYLITFEKTRSPIAGQTANDIKTRDSTVKASVSISATSDAIDVANELAFEDEEDKKEAESSTDKNIGDEKKNKIAKESMKGVRTLVFIVTAMGITWFPSVLVIITLSICSTCLPGGTYSVVIFWGYTNSLINPVCYALADKDFRDSFIRILSIRCLKKDASSSLSASSIQRCRN